MEATVNRFIAVISLALVATLATKASAQTPKGVYPNMAACEADTATYTPAFLSGHQPLGPGETIVELPSRQCGEMLIAGGKMAIVAQAAGTKMVLRNGAIVRRYDCGNGCKGFVIPATTQQPGRQTTSFVAPSGTPIDITIVNINENHNTNSLTTPPPAPTRRPVRVVLPEARKKKEGGMPTWGWLAIAGAAVAAYEIGHHRGDDDDDKKPSDGESNQCKDSNALNYLGALPCVPKEGAGIDSVTKPPCIRDKLTDPCRTSIVAGNIMSPMTVMAFTPSFRGVGLKLDPRKRQIAFQGSVNVAPILRWAKKQIDK